MTTEDADRGARGAIDPPGAGLAKGADRCARGADVTDGAVLAAVTARLHAQLPMTAFLRIEVVELALERVVLAAPLGPSRNHRGTGFGPALFTTAALAPWLVLVGRAWAAGLAVQILLGRCDFAIQRAVTGDYRARCDDVPALDVAALRRGERVKLTAGSRIEIDGAPAARYHAHYTIVPGGTAGDLALPFPEAWRA